MRLSETLRRLFPFHIILSILPVKEVEKVDMSGKERNYTVECREKMWNSKNFRNSLLATVLSRQNLEKK